MGFDPGHYFIGESDIDLTGNIVVFEGIKRKDSPYETLESTDLFLFDRSTDTVRKLTFGIFLERAHSPALSGDGRYLAFVFRGVDKTDRGGLIVLDIPNGIWRKIIDGECANPILSKDGHILIFESNETDLVPGSSGLVNNIYVLK